MKTTTVVPAGSVPSAGSISTGTGAGSASNAATVNPVGVVGKKGLRLRIQEMLSGFQTSIPPGVTVPRVPISGPPLDQAAVVAQLQGYLGSYTALDVALLALKAARPPVTALEKPAAAFLAELKLSLTTLFGPTSPQLALFGVKPKGVPRKLTGPQIAAKSARAANTRAIRGTKGKVQKAPLASGPMQVAVTPAAPPVVGTPGK